MNILTASNLEKSYPLKDIFENVSFKIEKGDKVGLIGANGAGKSTLFNILTGNLKADRGEIYIANDIKLGYLKQILSLDRTMTVYEYVLEVFEDLLGLESDMRRLEKKMAEGLGEDDLNQVMDTYTKKLEEFTDKNGYAIKSEIEGTLKAMGFAKEEFDKNINELSGGQKARAELAHLLLEKPDLILLDEPTNHLDIGAIRFLENFVKNYGGSVIVISHDRYFLDNTVNKVFILDHGKLHTYKGNYTEVISQRKKDMEVRIHQYRSQQREIKRQEEIIDRLKNQGGSLRKRGIAQSRSRQKLLDKVERIDKPIDYKKSMNLKFRPRIQSGMDVLKVEGLEKSYGNDLIFKDISFNLYRSEKVAIIGENGVGKTSLFKIILGEENKSGGSIRLGQSVNVGYFDQEQESLDLNNTIFEEISKTYPLMTNQEIRSYLAKFLFYQDDVDRLIGELSGGERARISLLKLMISDANFILMDEPTNHLDIDSKEILEDAILDYEGSVLLISHDRYFLNKISQKILLMKEDGMDEYLGNYAYYEKKLKESLISDQKEDKPTKTELKKQRQKDKLKASELRRHKEKIRKIEKDLEDIEIKIKELTDLTLEEGFYKDQEKVGETFSKIKNLEKDKEELTSQWLDLSMEIE
ncbi:MAG: ABC-F family ATP-binding cassette domain-containing protein [Anaerococcus sp.]|nr:ABC-F family ATP-binding cassette domain-containing protein [Anaerococcus sp.]